MRKASSALLDVKLRMARSHPITATLTTMHFRLKNNYSFLPKPFFPNNPPPAHNTCSFTPAPPAGGRFSPSPMPSGRINDGFGSNGGAGHHAFTAAARPVAGGGGASGQRQQPPPQPSTTGHRAAPMAAHGMGPPQPKKQKMASWAWSRIVWSRIVCRYSSFEKSK